MIHLLPRDRVKHRALHDCRESLRACTCTCGGCLPKPVPELEELGAAFYILAGRLVAAAERIAAAAEADLALSSKRELEDLVEGTLIGGSDLQKEEAFARRHTGGEPTEDEKPEPS